MILSTFPASLYCTMDKYIAPYFQSWFYRFLRDRLVKHEGHDTCAALRSLQCR